MYKKVIGGMLCILLVFGMNVSGIQAVTGELASVQVTTNKTNVKLDGTATLTVSGLMNNNFVADLSGATLEFSSSDEELFKVEEINGVTAMVRAETIKSGTATLTAKVTQGGVTKESSVNLTVIMEPDQPYSQDYSQTLTMKFMMAENDGTVKLTFEEALEVVKRMDNVTRGIPKIIYLIGWQFNGHDTGYPSWSVVNNNLKRPQDATAKDSLVWLMEEAKNYNTVISLHINMIDAYETSPLWNTYVANDIIAKNEDGSFRKDGPWGWAMSYTKEWNTMSNMSGYTNRNMAQARIDQLIDMFKIPDGNGGTRSLLQEAGTIHIDAFHQELPGKEGELISPYHKTQYGITYQDEIDTQKKIFRYWRSKGIDLTSEFAIRLRTNPLIGLQPMAWHFQLYDRMGGQKGIEVPANVYAGGDSGNGHAPFGRSITGEGNVKENPKTLPSYVSTAGWWIFEVETQEHPHFYKDFSIRTLPWYYLNTFTRVAFDDPNNAVTYSGHPEGTLKAYDDGALNMAVFNNDGSEKFDMVDGDNIFLPALWRDNKEIIAYSGRGTNRNWKLPQDWNGVTHVDVANITFGGLVYKETLTVGSNRMLYLELDDNEMVSIVPAGSIEIPGKTTQGLYLSDMNWRSATSSWGNVRKDRSVDNNMIKLEGRTYSKGIGTHTNSTIIYDLNGDYKRFIADIGLDDEKVNKLQSVRFKVYGDGQLKYDSGMMGYAHMKKQVDIDIRGVGELKLVVEDGGNGNSYEHVDWADARIIPESYDYLSDLSWVSATCGWRSVQRDKSVGGNPLKLNNVQFNKGIGTHADSTIIYRLNGNYTRFTSYIGVDSEENYSRASIRFSVYTDGQLRYRTNEIMTEDMPRKFVDLNLTGVNELKLVVDDGGQYGKEDDHGDWADAKVYR